MKPLLLTILLCASLFAGQDCFKDYAPAVSKVESTYKKAQYKHSLVFKDQYHYEIYPTTLFPFFCVPSDSIKKLLAYGTNHFCGTTIGLHLDKSNVKHLSIAVLQYTSMRNAAPAKKNYILHFFKFNTVTKEWDEDRPPMTVTMLLKNDGTYMSR